jgi:lambda family phage minor tail protein L
LAEPLNAGVARDLEGFAVGATVELFTIDLRPLGGGLERFAPMAVDGAAPRFGGLTYQVLPFESDGFEWSGVGPVPQPRLRFGIVREDGDQAAAASLFLGALEAFDDMLGAEVTRVETFRKHLDDGDDPDPQKHLGIEIFRVSQKSQQSPTSVEFVLTSALDLDGVEFPRRAALPICSHRYRRGAGAGSFDYTNATCPYTGTARFDRKGDPVADARLDVCGKTLADCKRRFATVGGPRAVLPFKGFPAIGRLR